MRRTSRGMWFQPENVPKEILLTGPKFHLNTTSGSGVNLREETFAKEIFAEFTFAEFIFAIYDLICKNLSVKM